MHFLYLLAAVLVFPSSSWSATNGNIGIYFDPSGLTCTASIDSGDVKTAYVIAKPAGNTSSGISTAEFRIMGLPSSWLVIASPATEALALGNPTSSGTIIAFPTCQAGSTVTLYTLTIIALSNVGETILSVLRKNPPSNSDFSCALLVGCDQNFTQYCAPIVQSVINPVGAGCQIIDLSEGSESIPFSVEILHGSSG